MSQPLSDLGHAVFVGTARNCAEHLPAALERWEALSGLFERADFLVAENDSSDGTKQLLSQWSSGRSGRGVIELDGLAAKGLSRSKAIAEARNALLEAVRQRPDLARADYLIVMDLDDASLCITPKRLARCMALQGWDGLFANQLFFYYDVWALRDNRRSPDDWVARVEAAKPAWAWLARLRHLTWRNRPIWPWMRPFAVRSAFGGLGVYRMPMALMSTYSGERGGRDICEHVPFNESLNDAGARLVLHPGMINMVPWPIYWLWRRIRASS